jgi:hypothetical protein
MTYNRRTFFTTLWTLLIGFNITDWKNVLFPPPKPSYNYDDMIGLSNLIRKSLPKLSAYDVCGVQPISEPAGLTFAWSGRKHKLGDKLFDYE